MLKAMMRKYCDGENLLVLNGEFSLVTLQEDVIKINVSDIEKLDPIDASRYLQFAVESLFNCTFKEKDGIHLYGVYIALIYNFIKYYSVKQYRIILDRGGLRDEDLERYYSKYCDSIDFYEYTERRY